MAQWCYHVKGKTNCTEDCRICLKEEIDEMKVNGISDEEINRFEEEWQNQRDMYAL